MGLCGLTEQIKTGTDLTNTTYFNWGMEYSQWRVVSRVSMVFFAALVLIGALSFGGVLNGTTQEAAIMVSIGAAAVFLIGLGMRKIDSAREEVGKKVSLSEYGFWDVCAKAKIIETADNNLILEPTDYVDFGRAFGTASCLNRIFSMIGICSLIIGIYAAANPNLDLSLAASFSIAGVVIILSYYGAVKLDRALAAVRPKLQPVARA